MHGGVEAYIIIIIIIIIIIYCIDGMLTMGRTGFN